MNIKHHLAHCAVLFGLLTALPSLALADRTIEVKQRFAGAFINGVLHADPMTGTPVGSAAIDVLTRGTLGKGVILGGGGTIGSGPEFTLNCLGQAGTFLRFIAGEDPLVLTFDDLSTLFVKSGSGEICIDLATGNSLFRFDVTFNGGRGRFAGASGYAVIDGEAEPVSADGSFSGETGTFVGWVTVPGDDDDDDSDSD